MERCSHDPLLRFKSRGLMTQIRHFLTNRDGHPAYEPVLLFLDNQQVTTSRTTRFANDKPVQRTWVADPSVSIFDRLAAAGLDLLEKV